MPAPRRFQVLVATDGSASARAAMTTAVRFPWPDGTRATAVVAKQVRADYRLSILLAALDRTAEFTARSATHYLRKRWPDGEARVVAGGTADGPLLQPVRSEGASA